MLVQASERIGCSGSKLPEGGLSEIPLYDYIDEVGNSDLGASLNLEHRYLSLTGIIPGLAYVDAVAFPATENLKRKYFGSHPDEPIILHRKELVNKKHPFECLRDPGRKYDFNSDLLSLLRDLDCTVVTVVIDKLDHQHL